jgi:hypothetical protein
MIRIFITLALTVTFAVVANAKNSSTEKAGVPPELKKMLDQFSEALTANNKAKASELSSFPLKNAVYGAKQTKSRKEFESSLKESTAGFCYGEKMPEKDTNGKDWALECDGNVFYFGQRGGKWKYLGYENINE